MRICGIKLGHDGAIALIEAGRLIFCVEREKRGNNRRYQAIDNFDAIVNDLAEHGLDPRDVDLFVVDGAWWRDGLRLRSGAEPVSLQWASYVESHPDGILAPYGGVGLILDGRSFPYRSYPHVTGHLAAAFCTSPFARAGQDAFALIWDGIIFPRLYYVGRGGAQFIEYLFPLIGQVYAAAADHFGPYTSRSSWDDLGVAGKLMAYIALGSADEESIAVFRGLYEERLAATVQHAANYHAESSVDCSLAAIHDFFHASAIRLKAKRAEDVLASFHCFLERLLIQNLTTILQQYPRLPGSRNLCIAGGCALNIKWNSALRVSGLFDAVWVPPFPNDSGAAIGAACSAMAADNGFVPLDWSVYSGPALQCGDVPPEWEATPCSMRDLAVVLASNKPVVFLAGRAELGPRALGGRSILAAATSGGMKNYLNDIKLREYFRPVAPICLEDRAPSIFAPGTPDPYMLFDHSTRAEWRDKVPAIVHLDGSARLQTIPRTSQHEVAELLVEYEKLTSIPLLCNTSANQNGRGFFPDVASACRWGRVKHVWSGGLLWTKRTPN
ncbi:carbamoyltransferase N-terminal domain-containing protein [Bradyrhizobium sp. CIAT3101]|uniref:nodulation protein NodU n=1 Tax=Bradyrhizobium sp. CIAT3101 TaxID=439387 RepID=UPI0024B1E938|nr:nodulation protein NodU [Bradyrhizobium sp. CIAT3101]WFU80326.1 carbamoyltransferase N-terminal domain-containing protein [Bradyrhizobium sp. CIAT3101]